MKAEASDIVKLLRLLAYEQGDHHCQQLYRLAERGEPILDICHEAIRVLATEKARYRKLAVDLMASQPPKPMIITKDEPLGD